MKPLRFLLGTSVALGILSGAGCGLPHDPNNTLHHVRGSVMQVGITESPPWVRESDVAPQGVEVEMAKRFAQHLNARIEWHRGSAEDNLNALEHGQLDLVLAGLTKDSPWKGRVGLSQPYYTDNLTIGFAPSDSQLANANSLQDVKVAVEPNSTLVAFLKQEGAKPLETRDVRGTNLPIAAPEWQLRDWGLVLWKQKLAQKRHVLATPPGENGWLVELERFLETQKSEVEPMLKQGSAS